MITEIFLVFTQLKKKRASVSIAIRDLNDPRSFYISSLHFFPLFSDKGIFKK